jgi:ABC-type uncharacterized transport system permease subunit
VIRVERRLATPRWLNPVIPLGAGVVALATCAILLAATGHDPGSTYGDMIRAAFTDHGALSNTLASTTPLLLTGLAAAVAFRMRIFNIGGEGQLYAGAIAAAGIGLLLQKQSPVLAITAMVLCAIVGGALWGAIPGLLRSYLNTNEIITSLMLNYVAGLLMTYLIFDSTSYWRDLSGYGTQVFPVGKTLDSGVWWPTAPIGDVAIPLGFLIGVGLAALLYLLMRTTRFGFEMRVIADSPAAAHYAGMRTKRLVVAVMMLSGALAGVAGASQVGDFSHVLEARGLQQAAYGFTGIVVAALARLNPVGVVAASFFLGAFTNASFKLQGPNFPQGLVGTVEGIIFFCVIGGELLVRYRVRIGRARSGAESLADASSLPAEVSGGAT